ncbi:hypothetical protein PFICI_04057 [Pestalotiopsis fici W106-1]|uniref:Uncharacterized protein n=1 Tax=Pestalotiopsis fici (strain W106-1 / CGMCC3.15140) TaxID=1229662 RepID=W3XKP0_PESFW|nr:uncharacterized protein PFICI_04057 [Pestalotiopsis fici W106-1]ETS86032.1 hypothetical protein PFICI_04057 [Pestalotiopsis fici W106-1]
MSLILFESSYDEETKFSWFKNSTVEVAGDKFKSACGPLWHRRKRLKRTCMIDQDLLDMLYLCRAEELAKRPKILDLAIRVREYVTTRDQAYYEGRENESDDAIRSRMINLLVNPGNYTTNNAEAIPPPDDSNVTESAMEE